MVKGVIFDMDGTMFDTERLSTKGWIYAGKKLGVDIPVALTDSFRGRNPQAIRKKFAAYFGDRLDYDTARAMKHEYFDEVTKESVPHKEGLQDLLEYLKEPCVNCFADMKINTFEEATKAINERIEKQEFYFAIFLQSENKVIGEIDASVESSNFVSKINDTFSPCWMLNNNYKGKGYAYEAAVAFFDYLFNVKGARRIYAYT